MDVIKWLEEKRPAFAELGAPEKAALVNFSLMWPFFEGVALRTEASFDTITDLARSLAAAGRIDEARIAPAMDYFANRYTERGAFTHHHPHLRLGKRDGALVNAVLLGKASAPWERLAGALLIAYRYRNNLFHGPKWEYDLQGQGVNFEVATDLLAAVIEMHVRAPG